MRARRPRCASSSRRATGSVPGVPVGASADIIEASWQALVDSYVYGLLSRAGAWQPLGVQVGPELRERF